MSYAPEQFKLLLTKSQNGDKDSYRDFLNLMLPLIVSNVSRQVINKTDVDDVVQESLLSIHKALATYDSSRDVLPWVNTIVNRRVIDYIRKISRLNRKEYLTNNGDVTFFEDETNKIVVDLGWLNKLPELTRFAITMTKLEGYSTKEAANILGLKENALRTKISRGMSQLKKHVKEGEVNE